MEQAAVMPASYLYPAGNESLPAGLETRAAPGRAIATLGYLNVSAQVAGP